MKYLKISSKGLMEPEALSLVGASSKKGDGSKIGQFGSGNKFAIAYLLRNNHDVKIFSGNEEIILTTEKKSFRDAEFDVILVNGTMTSITTEMGKDWLLWQAIREIYSNAIDEGEESIEMVNGVEKKEGFTSFYVSTNTELFDIVGNFNRYFADENDLLFENKYGKIYKNSDKAAIIYRKGIKCFNSEKKALYSYDFPNIPIDENRLVKYHWTIPEKMWELLFSCNDKEIIKTCLVSCSNSDYIEYFDVDFATVSGTLSKEFIEVVEELQIAPLGMSGLLTAEEQAKTVLIPTKVFQKIRGAVKETSIQEKFKMTDGCVLYRENENPSTLHKALLEQALLFLDECKMIIPYDVVIAKFEDVNVLGFADIKGMKIVLGEGSLDRGIHDVVNTIIEEYVHLKHKAYDETREFQTALINELVNYMKKVNSYTL